VSQRYVTFLCSSLLEHVSGFLLWPVRFVQDTRASMFKYRRDMLQRAALLQTLESAQSYEEWRDTALALDALEGSALWKLTPAGAHASDPISSICNTDILAARLQEFCRHYAAGNMPSLSSALRESLMRNTAGICHPDLHGFCRVGTKLIVEDYVNMVSFFLLRIATGQLVTPPARELVADTNGPGSCAFDDLSLDDKLKFFNETRHAYGRTALMLSGGAAMGLHHLGVVKALLDHDLLPKVVSGTSAGALVASIVGIFDDSDLRKILKSEDLLNPRTQQPFAFRFFDESLSIMRRMRRLLRKGAFQDVRMLQDALRKNYGDVTFGEAYRLTRRILNITVCPARNSSGPPLLLNYLTTPHVLIWSAASASCALPMVFAPVGLVAKDSTGRLVPYQPDGIQWIDGSVSSDVPLARIGELFNVNHFIVSQTNPHVIPRGLPIFHTRVMMLLKSEFQFRYWQALQLRLVPKVISQIFPHMLQPYEGDVTIMPEVNLRDLAQLFRNPTTKTIREFLRRGELQTFPKLDRVRLQCLIERTLDVCVDVVARASIDDVVHQRDVQAPGNHGDSAVLVPEQPSFGRVPSWLWVDSLPWGSLERRSGGAGIRNQRAEPNETNSLYDSGNRRP
jgi:TAG lipase / steryl ester hydrolase / phospholipase A2 / LPA acyltransferase